MAGHQPRRGFAGSGAFGIAARPSVGSVIGPSPLIRVRQGVALVRTQRRTVGARGPGTARIGDPSRTKTALGAPISAGVLAGRKPVLVGIAIAPGTIQCTLPRPGPARRTLGRLLLLVCQDDLLDD